MVWVSFVMPHTSGFKSGKAQKALRFGMLM
jgi:hypothetical protein